MIKKLYPLYTDGQLNKQAETLLLQIAESNGVPLASQTIQQARDSFVVKEWLGPCKESVGIKDIYIKSSGFDIPLRIYTPEGNVPLPILVFFHGGGFVLGTLDEFDPFCSLLADGANCIVVSVGYRLAPEHKHPAAVEDAVTALKWISLNAGQFKGDASRMAVAGDSAGANLSAVSSLIARDNGLPSIKFQVLICPWVDLLSLDTKSYKYFGDGLWLSKASICWYRNHYLQNIDQAKSVLVSPMLAKNMTGLPPALIITSEFDVLRDEGEAYAARLENAGVQVKYLCYKGMLHDFIVLPGLFNKAKDAIDEICNSLKNVFYSD